MHPSLYSLRMMARVWWLSISWLLSLGVASGLRYPMPSNFTVTANSTSLVPQGDGYTSVMPYLTLNSDNAFTLGFVVKSPNAYILSIWLDFPTLEFVEVVWSANRNDPVREGGYLYFEANRSLSVHDSDGREVWSTKTDGLGAVGLDLGEYLGNLVLYDENNATVWQSFDYPTDTLLQGQSLQPGMKLVSNVSGTNNSEGAYSLVMEAGGVALYASLPDPTVYWTWGYYGQTDLYSIKCTCAHPTTLTFVNDSMTSGYLGMQQNTSEISPYSSIKSDLCNLSSTHTGIQTRTFLHSFTRFMRLHSDGFLRVYAFNGALNVDYEFFDGQNLCLLPNLCGPYGVCTGSGVCSCPVAREPTDKSSYSFQMANSSAPSQGCTRSSSPAPCMNSTGDGQHLVELRGVDYFPNKFQPPSSNTTSVDECKNLCSTNCSCAAAFYYQNSGNCFVIVDALQSLQSVSDQSKLGFIKFGSVTIIGASPASKNHATSIAVGVTLPLLAILALLFAFAWYRRKRSANSDDDIFLNSLPGLPPRFSYKELHVATEGFTKQLGTGGFGTVYAGVLRDGTMVAVKKLEGAKQGKKEFRAEVGTIGSIHHVNLVRLCGFCVEGTYQMLVYEYMANGSLDRWLFASRKEIEADSKMLLNWRARFKIAVGTARGLAYLHEECRERILHLDIKPQNILLDNRFTPKVSDFGLSKLTDREESQVVTVMRGTPGYLAPEWLLHSGVTNKSDVYSYGMVLLELITGRRNLDLKCQDSEMRYLPVWALRLVQEGRALELVDKQLNGDFEEEEVRRAIDIVFLCIQEDMMFRPAMSSVVRMLEGREVVPERNNMTIKFSSSLGSGADSMSYSSSGSGTPMLHHSHSASSEMFLSGPR